MPVQVLKPCRSNCRTVGFNTSEMVCDVFYKSSIERSRNGTTAVGSILTRTKLLRSYLCKRSSLQKYQNLMHGEKIAVVCFVVFQ